MQFAQVPVNSPCAESHLQPVQVATSAQKDRTRDEAQRKLEWACLFCVLFMFVEFLGGYLAGSLAIMSDAAHLLSDVLSFFLSLFALYLSKFPASKTMSHGYKRAEVLGALTSIVVIWMLTLGLVWAAIQRIIALVQAPDSTSVPPVNGKAMFIVACMGLVVNIALMKILGHGHSHGGHGHSHGGGGHGHSHGAVSKEASSHHGHSHSHHGHSHSHGQDHVDHDASNRHEHHEDKHHACSHSEHDHHVRSQGHDEPVSPIGIDDESRVSTATACTHDSDDLEEPEAEPSVHVDGDGECAAENLNVRAAYLHALGDFLQSLGVCVAGALIWYEPSWQLCDPIVTLLFSVVVGATTIGICKTTLHVLMEGTPSDLDVDSLEREIKALPRVKEVHDLRVWSISPSSFAVAMHVVESRGDISAAMTPSLLVDVQACVMAHHAFDFVTVQVEQEREAKLCPFNQRHVVEVVV